MALKSTTRLKNHEYVVQKACLVKPGLEFLGIINERGKIIESIGTDCLSLSKGNREMFFMKIALRTSMQEDFDEYLGKVTYCLTMRGGKKFISVPAFNGNTIFVIIQNDYDHEDLINNILQTLKYSSQFLGEKIPKGGELENEYV